MHYVKLLLGMAAICVAALLIMSGITGGLLAFYDEIDAFLNPGFYHVETGGEMLPPPALIEKLEQARPEVAVWYLQYPKNPGETAMLTAEPKPDAAGGYPPIASNTFYLDPHSGEIVGEKYWGRCCFEPQNVLNYLYEMHHSLTDGAWGAYLMGGVAGVLLINCLLVLFGAIGVTPATDTLFLIPIKHKAVALVFALLLLPIALSSIAMNLADEVFKPLVSVFSPVKASVYEEYSKKELRDFGQRKLSYDDAYQLAQQLGRENGNPGPVAELFYSSSYNFYGMGYGYRDPDGLGNDWIYLDGADGHVVGARTPGRGTAGDQLFSLQLPIHSGRLAGLTTKILVALLGLLIAALSGRYIVIASRQLFRPKQAA
ncbi:MAG: PepSY domain-containing protein [Xanthomonadales bacterium]|nr:PepSY domain-containing protein [Xanthomonadales bacterium]